MQVHARFSERIEVGEDANHPVDSVLRSSHVNGVRSKVDGDVQTIFHQAKVFVAGPVQGLNTRGDFDGLFIQVGF